MPVFALRELHRRNVYVVEGSCDEPNNKLSFLRTEGKTMMFQHCKVNSNRAHSVQPYCNFQSEHQSGSWDKLREKQQLLHWEVMAAAVTHCRPTGKLLCVFSPSCGARGRWSLFKNQWGWWQGLRLGKSYRNMKLCLYCYKFMPTRVTLCHNTKET